MMLRSMTLLLLCITLLFGARPSVLLLHEQDTATLTGQSLLGLLDGRMSLIDRTIDSLTPLSFRDKAMLIPLDLASSARVRKSAEQLPLLLEIGIDTAADSAMRIIPITSMVGAINELTRLYKHDVQSVALIVDEANRAEAHWESYFLSQAEIAVTEIILTDSMNNLDRKRMLKKISAQGISHVRFMLKRKNQLYFQRAPMLRTFIKEHFSTLYVNDDESWRQLFPALAVVSLRENENYTAAVLALTAATMLEDTLPEKSKAILLNSTIAALSMGSIHHFTLGDCGRYSIDATRLLLKTAERPLNWEDTKELFGKNSALIKTGAGLTIPTYKKIEARVEESMLMVLRTLFEHRYYSYAVSLLLVLVLSTFLVYKIVRRLKDNQLMNRSALFFPIELRKVTLETFNKPVKIADVFTKNGYSPLLTSSTIQMQQLIRRYMPDIFVVDWREQRAVNYLRKELSGYSLSSAETVVLLNIPKNRHAEAKEAFGSAVCLCFEEFPHEATLVEALNKKGGNDPELTGRIRKGDTIPSVMQLLETERATGCLVTEDTSPLSVIYYQEGAIVHSEDRIGNRGEEAIYTALRAKKGRFQFLSDRRSPMQSTHFSVMEILLSFAERSDNANR